MLNLFSNLKKLNMKTLKPSDFQMTSITKTAKGLLIAGVTASALMLGSCSADDVINSCTDSDTGTFADDAGDGSCL